MFAPTRRNHCSGAASNDFCNKIGPSRPFLKNSCQQCPVCGRLRVGKSFLHVADWSVQPCVRPTSAVHMTAGHNALRGSGPGQKPAFDNALAHVGCPDRRIDRLCITCCSSSQPSHHVGCPARSRLRRQRDGLLVTLALGHHGPGHPSNLVGKRDGGDLRRAPT